MNKLYRYILIGILALIPCFTNAVDYEVIYLDGPGNAFKYRQLQSTQTFDNSRGYLACFQIERDQANCPNEICGTLHMGNDTAPVKGWSYMTCTRYAGEITLTTNYSNNYYTIIVGIDSLYPNYTSLECQTEYNLIPVSEVTANYCKLNYDLIDPADCPLNEGTGAIVRSNLTINNTPYAQNQNINVYIPDFLAWNVAFNDFNTTIEVEGYNADEDYINNVIDQEKLTPTNEDFTNMILALTGFIPYLFIALLFFWIVRIINRIWK